jgi:hypothetical protein
MVQGLELTVTGLRFTVQGIEFSQGSGFGV